jgi:hypothetical protein
MVHHHVMTRRRTVMHDAPMMHDPAMHRCVMHDVMGRLLRRSLSHAGHGCRDKHKRYGN